MARRRSHLQTPAAERARTTRGRARTITTEEEAKKKVPTGDTAATAAGRDSALPGLRPPMQVNQLLCETP